MIEYNKEIANMLMKVSDASEGSLLNNTNPCVKLQVELIERTLDRLRPQYIIETGTNKAFFSFICLSFLDKFDQSVTIETFDMADFSLKATTIVNDHFKRHKVIFHQGNSLETLTSFNPIKQVDLFFVDGGHSYEVAVSDMRNAVRMNSPLILIDDTGGEGVAKAIDYELMGKYQMVDGTERSDDRRMRLYAKF
jgi:hypothetical protein